MDPIVSYGPLSNRAIIRPNTFSKRKTCLCSSVWMVTYCQANKLMFEHHSKDGRQGKSKREYSSFKAFFDYSHWRRRGEMKGSCVCLCLLSVLLRFCLWLHQGTCLAVSEWLSWEKHRYPFIRTINHISLRRDTHGPVSNLQSTRWHLNLGQVLACDYKSAAEEKKRSHCPAVFRKRQMCDSVH